MTSPAGQLTAQLCWGVRLAEAAGALVMEADCWGAAMAPATRATRATEYFIVINVMRTGGWMEEDKGLLN